jgi:hypothetical protein
MGNLKLQSRLGIIINWALVAAFLMNLVCLDGKWEAN